MTARYIVGIDLGTTNTVVACADTAGSSPDAMPRAELFPLPQWVGAGEVAPRPSLPSARYQASEEELPEARTLHGEGAPGVLGALALGLGVMVYRRLRLRLELPVEILRQTLERIRNGDARARCVVGPGPTELRQIARDLNAILDRGVGDPSAATGPTPARRDTAELRRLVAWALDQHAAPTLVIDEKGHPVAMNQAMQERQEADDARPVVDAEGTVTDGWVVSALDGTSLRVVQPAAS